MPSILAIVQGIYRNQLTAFILKTKHASQYFFALSEFTWSFEHFEEKIERDSLIFSKFTQSKKRDYLNA